MDLGSAVPELRRRAVAKMQEHSRTDLSPGILGLLKHEDANIRRDAAEALGFIGYEAVDDAGKALSPLLYDPDASVREEAAIALWRLVYLPAVAEFQKVMCFDPSASVRRSVARMLGSFDVAGGAASHQSFYEYALRDEDPVVRANAAVGLGLGGRTELSDRISRLLEAEQDPMARAGYLCGLWLLCGKSLRTEDLAKDLGGSRVRSLWALEEFVRLGQDPEIFAETCQWIHRYLDGKPSGAEALQDLSRIRAALRVYPEADDLVRRIALWQGELTVEKAKAAAAGTEPIPE